MVRKKKKTPEVRRAVNKVRQWYTLTHRPPCPQSLNIRIVSYNILSPVLMSRHPELYDRVDDGSTRMMRVSTEIKELSPQLVALQEVETNIVEAFATDLNLAVAVFAPSGSRDRSDGCLLLYDAKRFTLIHHEFGILDAGANKLNSFAIATFDDLKTQKKLIFATAHLLFNPKRGDIRFLQIESLALKLALLAHSLDGAALILCGDLNSTPSSAVYTYLSTGAVDAHFARLRTSPPSWTEEHPHLRSGHKGNGTALVDRSRQNPFSGDVPPQLLKSPLPSLVSAYAQDQHDIGEPAFTTYLPHGTKACVDYLFYDSSLLFAIRRLELPPLYLLRQAHGIPAHSTRFEAPSDHLALAVDLAFRIT